ncbi:hypothetical protein QCA50_006135 [Cerrena zonata]|uniref:Cupin type-1 domain-containing protein n=1 Tax=Cerrena zonata TaxID=2478898 RepID=A0AAW0GM85_9APHY
MVSIKFTKAVICAVIFATLSTAAPAGSASSVSNSAPLPSSAALPPLSETASGAVNTSVPSASASSALSPISAPRSTRSATSTPSSTVSAPDASQTVPYASDDPNGVLWGPNDPDVPQAIRGSLGATVLGPQDVGMVKENPDLLAPPTTDAGSVDNAKWPFSLSHNRLQSGGWARQENVGVMPFATSMAGVNMRLEAGAVRELHWHKTAEWGYILKGSVQITSVNQDGQNFLSTIGPGDIWYFPPGIPHSIQATGDLKDGSEFLLVFDDGSFSEDSTFLLTDWLAHVPKEVLAKNFQTNITAFDHIPAKELYIFPMDTPSDDASDVKSPQGTIPQPFTFKFSDLKPTQLSGGSAKVVDSTTFDVSKTIAAAEVTVEPGAMRELHVS